ncbi:MAG: aminotransferase class I/II-fold pyridoxal phosphate-dependent enzyme [Myxococcales bacterium]|nr:aminotransferase class I/II-fold pyridoxal phosphate-dependent enzyme [Myxococcales bacterium]MCB9520949.1 aminotransferase class I/II-fold pyridoxal phosphate-dependent enzyme [Myxococcales bacterium]MCB9531687.1 aminotransferase class I/II-fold pyridoxal phosphate-dependent enzyme [Myxococcales bacterium]MCB9534426.1 aminotransferase class I/II-fold pyridoxal phosphate-dependent enzyme [Myxococcales bacterium]
MTRACVAVGGVNMGQGICDTPTPAVVKDAAKAAIDAGHSTYTRFDGVPELRTALAERLLAHNGLRFDAESEIVVTLGSAGAYICALNALLDPGDGIILFEPFYGYHLNAARVAGVVPSTVRLEAPAFAFDDAALRSALRPNTKAILVNTPMNPCGKVFTRAELERVADFAIEHDLLIFTDEVYEYLVYDGAEHVSVASIDRVADRTVTMGSYSKTFSITGWRIGFAAAPAALAEPIGLMNDLNYICAAAPLQHAVAAGVRQLPRGYYSDLAAEYQAKRDQFCGVLTEVGLTPVVPQGAYYVLADVSSLGLATAKEAAMTLLRDAGVASIAGSAFYDGGGEQLTRFCYAKSTADLDRACEQLRRWAARR